MIKKKTILMLMVLVLGGQPLLAYTGPYIFDWSIRDMYDPNFPDFIPVPLPGHDRSPFFVSIGGPETLHPYYSTLFNLLNTQGKPRAFMLVNNSNPIDGNDPLTNTLGYDNVIDVVAMDAAAQSFATPFDMVFGDFETGNDITAQSNFTVAMVNEAKAFNPNVFVANYPNYPGATDNSRIKYTGGYTTDRSADAAFYTSSGQNVAMPNCYPYEAYDDHFSNTAWGANICPNKRSALFWAPLEKFCVAKRALPVGHLLIPYVARFIDWETDHPTNPTYYTAPVPTREDVVALIQHFRLRGADGFYRLQSTGLIDWTVNPVAYYADEYENRGDNINAWKALDIVFNNSGTLTFLNNTFPTNKTTGVEWSGIQKGSKVAILISNLGNTATSITLPAIPGLPATSDVIPAGTHQLKIYETILPSDDACAKTNGTLTNALYTSYNAGSTDVANYIKFSLSSIVPTAGFRTDLYAAKLTVNAPARVGAGYTDAVFTVSDDSWTEAGLTWANKPAAISQLSSWTTPASASTITVNTAGLKDYVEQQANGDALVSFAVKDLNASKTSSQYQQYPDSDADTANCFKLAVEYTMQLITTPAKTEVINFKDITWVSEQGCGYWPNEPLGSQYDTLLHTSWYYGDVASYIKYDLTSIKNATPAGYTAVVDSLSVKLYAGGLLGADYTDAFYTTSDDWTAETLAIWASRPVKGTQLTSWTNGYFIAADASSTPAWKTYAQDQINGDGIMSLCMEDVGISADPNQRETYYGRAGGGYDPKLTMTYHYELMPAPSNCAEAIARGYGFDADFNNDCYVNMKDFSMFAKYWLDTIN